VVIAQVPQAQPDHPDPPEPLEPRVVVEPPVCLPLLVPLVPLERPVAEALLVLLLSLLPLPYLFRWEEEVTAEDTVEDTEEAEEDTEEAEETLAGRVVEVRSEAGDYLVVQPVEQGLPMQLVVAGQEERLLGDEDETTRTPAIDHNGACREDHMLHQCPRVLKVHTLVDHAFQVLVTGLLPPTKGWVEAQRTEFAHRTTESGTS
jgi:hypothetical protein